MYVHVVIITLECGCLCVVVNEVSLVIFSESYLPSTGERQLLSHGASWILPLSYLTLVVGKVDSAVWKYSPL